MPTREQTITHAIQVFEKAKYPSGLDAANAWLGNYQTLLWYEPINLHDLPRAIISTKWSLRHDRLSDITNECPVYKAAYGRVYRQARREQLLYYVVTNEYDPARLNKVLDDSCVDGVVHIHKAAVVDVCGLNGRLLKLIDLASFIKSTLSW